MNMNIVDIHIVMNQEQAVGLLSFLLVTLIITLIYRGLMALVKDLS